MANVFLQLPPDVSPAFNPVRVVAQTPAARYAQLTKELAGYLDPDEEDRIRAELAYLEPDRWQQTLDPLKMALYAGNGPGREIVLERTPDADGKAVFDLSHILRHAFADETYRPYDGEAVAIDYRLAVTFTLDTGSFRETHYTALNAVEQLGRYDGKGIEGVRVLSQATSLTKYAGYPLAVAVLIAPSIRCNYKLVEETGAERNGKLIPSACVIEVEGPGRLELWSQLPMQVVRSYSVSPGCVPDAPFYIRWINVQGGYDAWMFCRRKKYEQRVGDVYNVERDHTAEETFAQQTLSLTAVRTVTAGDDALLREAFDLLAGIPLSPRIEWYDEEIGAWQTIVLDDDNTLAWNTDSGVGSVEFVFRLPPVLTQF